MLKVLTEPICTYSRFQVDEVQSLSKIPDFVGVVGDLSVYLTYLKSAVFKINIILQ